MKKITVLICALSVVLFAGNNVLALNTNDPYLKYQSYLTSIKLSGNYTGKGVIVAVIDEGISQNNPDLKNALWKNYKETINNSRDDDGNGYIDDYYGYNFVDNNANMNVKGDHGTAVASIIAAERNNGYGIAGIAPDVKVMSLIACDDSGCSTEAIIKAIRYAVDNGAQIINLSLGGNGSLGYNNDYDSAISYATSKGVLLVASAGNSDPEGVAYGKDLSIMKQSPVCNDGVDNLVLGVGATSYNDTWPVYWSSYSDKYVDIWAPGEKIAVLSVEGISEVDAEYKDGTSFSAPIVAAAAALLKEQNPSWNYIDLMSKLLSSSQVLSRMTTYNSYKFLDIGSALSSVTKETRLDALPVINVAANGKLTLTGQFFYHSNSYSISGASINLQVPANAVKLISINKTEIDLSKISPLLNSGSYSIKISNVSNFDKVNFTVTGNDQNTSSATIDNLNNNFIKVDGRPGVYWLSPDNKKYLFSNRDTFSSWFVDDFSGLRVVSQDYFDNLILGGNITVKSGKYIKFDNSNNIYLVKDSGRICRAKEYTGKKYIIQSSFEANYTNIGDCL